jgi:hypothetical protein
MSREQAAKQAGMGRQTLRDWVIRFNVEGVEGLRDRPRSGRPPFLGEGQMAAFKALVLRGPDPERDGVSSWTAKDLCRIVLGRFGVSYRTEGATALRAPQPLQPGARLAPALQGRRATVDASLQRLPSRVDAREQLDPRVELAQPPPQLPHLPHRQPLDAGAQTPEPRAIHSDPSLRDDVR